MVVAPQSCPDGLPTDRDDRHLVAQINAGNTAALGELYNRYCDRAYRVALSICRDPGSAEDAVQNAFVAIWRARASYQERRGTVAAWLLSIVHYRALDVLRADHRHASRRAGIALLDEAPDCHEIADEVIAKVEREIVRPLIDLLPDTQREVIVLAFYGGLSHTQIAAHLDVPPGTVKGRMRLGLGKLRAQIQR